MSAAGQTKADKLRERLGPCVLLRIPKGKKAPAREGWQKLTLADMTPDYVAGFNGANIGVSLGAPSGGLCTVDADSDENLEAFLEVNPALCESLISRGKRGGNVWLRVRGEYPKAGKLKTADGEPWGEWRATGNQTVIAGKHPSGCEYRDNGARPREIEFSEIAWPDGLRLPWQTNEATAQAEPDPFEGVIVLPSGPIGLLESGRRCFRILAPSKELFLRGGRVFVLATGDDGEHRLELVTEQNFRSRIERHGKVIAFREGAHGEKLVKWGARCSLDTAKVWLESDAKNQLPHVAAIHNCALLVARDGGVEVLGKGYHAENGGRLIVGGDTPHRMELSEARELLLESVGEYDFATPADESRAMAALITPAMRSAGLLSDAHVPLTVIEADDSQTGKGYLLEQIQATYRETASMVAQRTGGVGGFDESLSQAMIEGRPFIQLENVRGLIGSTYFEAILTCPIGGTVPARVPYKGEVQVRPDHFIFQLTSNGFESTRDLANRSSIVRLRKRRGYSFRRYPEGYILDHVRANQPRYLGAVFCVIGQWLAHGRQATDDTRGEGRFRAWAQALDWIVRELLGLAPLMDGHEAAQERAANPALSWLRQVCLAAEAAARMEEPLTASEIAELSQEAGIQPPGVRDDAPDEKVLLRIGQVMAKVFRERDTIEIDGFRVRRIEHTAYSETRQREVTNRRYEIASFRPVRPVPPCPPKGEKFLDNVNVF